MIARYGYDQSAADAMKLAYHSSDETFHDRAMRTEFWGLYDPEPIGAVIVEGALIHVASTKPGRCGFAVRSIVEQCLKDRPYLACPIREGNSRAIRLALGMGFKHALTRNGWCWYRRMA